MRARIVVAVIGGVLGWIIGSGFGVVRAGWGSSGAVFVATAFAIIAFLGWPEFVKLVGSVRDKVSGKRR